VVAAKRLYLTAGVLFAVGLGCLAVALARNDNVEDAFATLGASGEGAYFNRSGGYASSTFDPSEHTLDPFRLGNAYLWLGAGIALVVAGLAIVLIARQGSPARRPG
jgi:hypothetical protein